MPAKKPMTVDHGGRIRIISDFALLKEDLYAFSNYEKLVQEGAIDPHKNPKCFYGSRILFILERLFQDKTRDEIATHLVEFVNFDN